MVRCTNYHLNIALSAVALGCVGLNSIDNNKLAITTFVAFILTEIVFFIKNIQSLRAAWIGLVSCEFFCTLGNLSCTFTLLCCVFIDCMTQGSFHFQKVLGYLCAPVVFSTLLWCNSGSYVVYDIVSSVQTLRGRFASPPSMGFDVAVVEYRCWFRRSYLPAYSEADKNPPTYSMYDEDPPTYNESCFNDGEELEDNHLIGYGEDASGGCCIPSVCGGIPSYRDSRSHRIIESSNVEQIIVDMETVL